MYLRKWLFIIFFLLAASVSFAQDSIALSQIISAEKLFGLEFTASKRDSIVSGAADNLRFYRYLHQNVISNDVPLPLWFDPVLPGKHFNHRQLSIEWSIPDNVILPRNIEELAFYSIPQLASLIRSKKISSVALTRFYLERLKKYGTTLHCVIELTENLALKRAAKADADLAKGVYKSPLQGIPYGLKDLFAVKGTHTTWGTPPYKDQVIDENCFVEKQLEKAGAVLVAKLSLGELAMDDIWFGGLTRNPWNIATGSGGSSAGSTAATVAGLVPFAIGTETFGSIVDPSMRCGATGLRPTYGSISRSGAMALAWSSDKIGPICRSAEDAAIVFAYIHGADDGDRSSRLMPFNYNVKIDLKKLKIAYIKNYIDTLPENCPEKLAIETLKEMGLTITPFEFPRDLHADALLSLIINAESAAAFDDLTRSNKDDEMVQQNKDRWPNSFRTSRFIPAVEYINACRMRYLIMQKMDSVFSAFDIIIAPPETGEQLAATNLSGNPAITLPIGFTKEQMPVCISFIGKLYDEATLVAFAKKFQDATNFHLQHPPTFR
jgi:Asp-tRNA(Asn)/Glu-tRNA(Gln) amidotransferase A subunit family amidase